MLDVRIQLLSDKAILPVRAHEGDSGYDLALPKGTRHKLYPNDHRIISLDLALELPPGCEGQIRPRSSNPKNGFLVMFGTVDNGYRGNVGVSILALREITLEPGSRVAQLCIVPVPETRLVTVDSLSPSGRGNGGFGSTGV